TGQPCRELDDLTSPTAGVLVAGERTGPADVALAGTGCVHGGGPVDTVGADQELGDLAAARGRQHHQPGPGPDRRQHVLDGRRAEQPDGALVRFLDRLERGGERDRRVGTARARWPGEQPGMGHVACDGSAQALDHPLLADEVVEDGAVPNGHSSASTAARITAAISSTSPWASSTR